MVPDHAARAVIGHAGHLRSLLSRAIILLSSPELHVPHSDPHVIAIVSDRGSTRT